MELRHGNVLKLPCETSVLPGWKGPDKRMKAFCSSASLRIWPRLSSLRPPSGHTGEWFYIFLLLDPHPTPSPLHQGALRGAHGSLSSHRWGQQKPGLWNGNGWTWLPEGNVKSSDWARRAVYDRAPPIANGTTHFFLNRLKLWAFTESL